MTTTTHTLGPITYDVHGDLAGATPERPVLVLVGSPMDASGFGTLAGHFTDRPVVTLDPRGTGRNGSGEGPLTPEEHAADLHALVQALDAGPVDLFASSGGAVNALALLGDHPEDVRRVVAHEPPLVDGLPDRDVLVRVLDSITSAYAAGGTGPGMAAFISAVMQDGPVDEAYLAAPAPDPAMFGLPSADDGSRDDALMRNLPACNLLVPDYESLGALGDRLVMAVGAASGDTFAARGARQVADRLGRPAAVVPGDHAGFLGGEYGQTGEPDAFAAALRALLDA